MGFRGLIEDALVLKNLDGMALMLTHIDGMPAVGMKVLVDGRAAMIRKLGRNTTDGKAVSSRSCLTGAPCAPYGSILVDWLEASPDPKSVAKSWVIEARDDL